MQNDPIEIQNQAQNASNDQSIVGQFFESVADHAIDEVFESAIDQVLHVAKPCNPYGTHIAEIKPEESLADHLQFVIEHPVGVNPYRYKRGLCNLAVVCRKIDSIFADFIGK